MGDEDGEPPLTEHNATTSPSGPPSTPMVFFSGGSPPMRQATRPSSSLFSAGTANLSGPSRDTHPASHQASVFQRPATATETYIKQTKGVATSTLSHILFSALDESAVKLPVSTSPVVARPALSAALRGGHQSLSSGSGVAPPVTGPILTPSLPSQTLATKPTPVAQVLSTKKKVAMGPKGTDRAPSAIQKVMRGGSAARPSARKPSKGKGVATDNRSKKGKGVAKARRSKDQDSDDQDYNVDELSDSSDLADPSDDELTRTPTVTKSGRQVTRPSPYKPASSQLSAKKRKGPDRAGKPELCALCTRWPSFPNDKIVNCNDCGAAWHQRCHNPKIPDEAAADEANWVCGTCKSGQPSKKSKGQAKQNAQIARELDSGDADSDDGSQRSPPPDVRNWSKAAPRGPAQPRNAIQEQSEKAWPFWQAPGYGGHAKLPPEAGDKERVESYNDQSVRHVVYNEEGVVIWRDGKFEKPQEDAKGKKPQEGAKGKKVINRKRKA